MILPALFFYLFAGVCVASAVMVIASRNPVHSVLFLILAFVNASGLFILMGAEFLGMVLIFVYVGAVATLFLFVIMMLDVDFAELREGFIQYLPVGIVIGGIFLFELLLTVGAWVINPTVTKTITAPIPNNVSNTEALGLVLYTQVHPLLPARRHGAAGRHDRRDRADARATRRSSSGRTSTCRTRARRRLAMSVRKVASGQGLLDSDAAEWVK